MSRTDKRHPIAASSAGRLESDRSRGFGSTRDRRARREARIIAGKHKRKSPVLARLVLCCLLIAMIAGCIPVGIKGTSRFGAAPDAVGVR
jgi:hypothetical protein